MVILKTGGFLRSDSMSITNDDKISLQIGGEETAVFPDKEIKEIKINYAVKELKEDV